jgi:hypothetical protein
VLDAQLGQWHHLVRRNHQGIERGLQSRLGLIDLTGIDKRRDGLDRRYTSPVRTANWGCSREQGFAAWLVATEEGCLKSMYLRAEP